MPIVSNFLRRKCVEEIHETGSRLADRAIIRTLSCADQNHSRVAEFFPCNACEGLPNEGGETKCSGSKETASAF